MVFQCHSCLWACDIRLKNNRENKDSDKNLSQLSSPTTSLTEQQKETSDLHPMEQADVSREDVLHALVARQRCHPSLPGTDTQVSPLIQLNVARTLILAAQAKLSAKHILQARAEGRGEGEEKVREREGRMRHRGRGRVRDTEKTERGVVGIWGGAWVGRGIREGS